DTDGCLRCHFDSPATSGAALSIVGLPKEPEPGQSYLLTLVLTDPALVNAGFMLSVSAGTLDPADERTEAIGQQARSTRAGSSRTGEGRAEWQLNWRAPATLPLPLRFDLWGNAGNDDLSPFGDTIHHRTWRIP
ncbi:MAG: choice-of-anchor V domain-containing protein, partial [Gammaproteobacteria bacterium]|nr:choice-of-anchor V domain-containing protein [Gammaproteobacteria bacterium]